MANQEQLEILQQGPRIWNKWRDENSAAKIDLTKAHLSEAELSEINLRDADLSEADLHLADLDGANLREADLHKASLKDADLREINLGYANLREANLGGANLRAADLSGANLSGADLSAANLSHANLREANLSGAHLHRSNLSNANLNKADLYKADLHKANLSKANLFGGSLRDTKLDGANLSEAIIGNTVFANIDLCKTLGLKEANHKQPSTIGANTLRISNGKIPEAFLRGCGLADWEIESAKLYIPNISNSEMHKVAYKVYDLRASQAVQISPLFIVHSHLDGVFVDHLEESLHAKGVRFWRDVHDAMTGHLEIQIDRAMRQNPTILLILSKNSINSDWAQHEFRKARELEKEFKRAALCPIALDDSWKSSSWPQRLMEQIAEYNITDFSAWKNDVTFQAKLAKVLGGLDLFYKKAEK